MTDRMTDRSETEKELRKELRRIRHKEMDILTKNRYGKRFSLESILNKYLPDSL